MESDSDVNVNVNFNSFDAVSKRANYNFWNDLSEAETQTNLTLSRPLDMCYKMYVI